MKLIGLTGGIATGKSTVSKLFNAEGIPVIDADLLAREVVEPGTEGLRLVGERFAGVLTPDGRLDRKKLGERVFGHPAELAALNALLHPRIRALARQRTAELAATGVRVAIYDAPLLIENQLHLGMDGVIVVWCSEATQLERLQRRDGFTAEQALARVRAQMPMEEQKRAATWLIDNGGTVDETALQVKQVIAAMTV